MTYFMVSVEEKAGTIKVHTQSTRLGFNETVLERYVAYHLRQLVLDVCRVGLNMNNPPKFMQGRVE